MEKICTTTNTNETGKEVEFEEKLTKVVRESVDFLRANITKFNEILQSFGLLDDNEALHPEINAELERILQLQEEEHKLLNSNSLSKDISKATTAFAVINEECSALTIDPTNYDAAKLRRATNEIRTLNKKTRKNLQELEALLKAQKVAIRGGCLTVASVDERRVLVEKVKQYERTLEKFECKYPWLKDERLRLGHIAQETEQLDKLKRERDALRAQMSRFHGLKPDLQAAAQQLETVKRQHQEINNKLMCNVKQPPKKR